MICLPCFFVTIQVSARAAVASNIEEAQKLIEAGFEYVCTTTENLMLFRKRKGKKGLVLRKTTEV
jgi:hypothetical protein